MAEQTYRYPADLIRMMESGRADQITGPMIAESFQSMVDILDFEGENPDVNDRVNLSLERNALAFVRTLWPRIHELLSESHITPEPSPEIIRSRITTVARMIDPGAFGGQDAPHDLQTLTDAQGVPLAPGEVKRIHAAIIRSQDILAELGLR